ncbi:hypothetical protein EAF04_007383 [Stromatinia cepivora]|nr:hypothetical protein EAF04_007383 [Stromatinia cepivora]
MTSSIILCCPATRIPRAHPSILLSIFLSALDARLRHNTPFSLLTDDAPANCEAILELQEIKEDNTMRPKYHMRYFVLINHLEENRAYIEMYPGESFGELELEAVECWRMGREKWWDVDGVTDERVTWRCSDCRCSYAVRVLRGSGSG